ncbi:MAG: hypothetical protein JXR59_06200 [Desulfuromonadaceae bacterium]|nr:hypothetical protein [Desulfuromonadaceae bacterium]
MTAAVFARAVKDADYIRIRVNAPVVCWLPVEKDQALLWRDRIAEGIFVNFETGKDGRWLWIG